MLARHSNELLSRLEKVEDVGCVEIRKRELLHWYGQERMTIGIWRDLAEKWQEVLDQAGVNSEVPLLVGEAAGTWTLIWGEGLITSETSWFKNLGQLATRRTENTDEAA